MAEHTSAQNRLRALVRNKPSIIVAAGLVVVVTLWMATGSMGGDDAADQQALLTPGDESIAADLFAVQVATLEAQSRADRIVINGRTEPFRTVAIRAEIEGRLVELGTYRGETIAEGDTIARIALYDRQARLAEARALLRQREIEYSASASLVQQEFRSETQHAAAMAQLDAARAVVEQRLADIARTHIRSPFDGIVQSGHLELGNYVKAGDIVGTIMDMDPILVVGHATEMEVAALTLGGPGVARLVDQTTIVGTVTFIAVQADPATRTYRYEIEVPNPDYAIRAGLTAQILIEGDRTMAHLIPASSLTLSERGDIGVKTVDSDALVRFFAVRIMEDSADGMWVGGLPETVQVIVGGQEFVTEGEPVLAVEAGAPPENEMLAADGEDPIQ